MSKPINLVGKSPEEIKRIVAAKAALGVVFLISRGQVTYLQLRAGGIDKSLVAEYTPIIRNLPPGEAFLDPETGAIFLIDGIHRAEAHVAAGSKSGVEPDAVPFPVHFRIGSYHDALLAAAGSNKSHGKRRSRKDTENAATKLVLDPVLGRFSNNRLAEAAEVSPPYIETIRKKLEREGIAPRVAPEDRIGLRNGKVYKAKPKIVKPKSGTPDAVATDDDAKVPVVTSDDAVAPEPHAPASLASTDTDGLTATAIVSDDVTDGVSTAFTPSTDPTTTSSDIAVEIARKIAETVQTALIGLPTETQADTRRELLNQLQAGSVIDESGS